jgi:hypothetical protein
MRSASPASSSVRAWPGARSALRTGSGAAGSPRSAGVGTRGVTRDPGARSKVSSAARNISRWWRSRSSASRNDAAASARPSSSASRIMRGSTTSISTISPVAAVWRFSRVVAIAPIVRR